MDHTRSERISPLATRSLHRQLLAVDLELVRRKARDAAASSRGREIHVLHEGDGAVLQRMLNALQPGSYVTPHRHLSPPRAESVVLLQGSVGAVAFADDGEPLADGIVVLSRAAGVLAVDFRPAVWHTFFALEPDTVVFEVKPGPYAAASDKDFAPWAPREGEPGAARYLARLEDRLRQRSALPPRRWQPAT